MSNTVLPYDGHVQLELPMETSPHPDAVSQLAMQSWKKFNQLLAYLTEDQLTCIIEAEKVGKRRLDILKRAFQRRQVSLDGAHGDVELPRQTLGRAAPRSAASQHLGQRMQALCTLHDSA